MVLKGFRLGMVLQLAVGPISLFIFQIAVTLGTIEGLKGVVGVTLGDGLFVFAAILGLGTLIDRNKNVKTMMKYGGGLVLFLFGISTILGAFGIDFIPSLSLSTNSSQSVFTKTVIMTIANPLTIVFWAGVFSTKMVEEKMTTKMMYLFGIGAVLSTLIFQSLLTIAGGILSVSIDPDILLPMNVIVGLFLIGFSVKTVMKKV